MSHFKDLFTFFWLDIINEVISQYCFTFQGTLPSEETNWDVSELGLDIVKTDNR